ncbi:MAG TPA: pseudouridine-5'-phosphate glycosidase [Candidatus Limnocylindrales bacterium]|nr:pseudouridine-5'-phosphate glycosidase [Candidatus Limnocylindrales bacterium]
MAGRLVLAPTVEQALAADAAVVALESTLISHGLPRPRNLEVARAAEAAVRAAGAVPATIALRDGVIRVGLGDTELAELAAADGVPKVSRRDLAWALGRQGWAATTVSATMIGADLAGIRVFATGGIGGVHRGGERTLDVSADLDELARTPVLVVCAGPKSILDVALTLEVLETRGVPVIGFGTDELAGFYTRGSDLPVSLRVDTAEQAAALALRHWSLGLATGLVVAVPLPEDAALPADVARTAVEEAHHEAETRGIRGPATTPFLLTRIAELTDGRSLQANAALIEHNAHVAADIAVAMAGLASPERD